VPTWNYLAVHEQHRAQPWSIDDAPEAYIDQMLRGIVGLQLIIRRLEGKWKMSQNRPEADQAGVRKGLVREDGEAPKAVAEIMSKRLDGI
jgi:transcriptional regulator